MRLNEMFASLWGRAQLGVQGALRVVEGQVYDSDFMLLRPREGGYRDRLPEADDVLLLVEVADASFRRDRRVKLPVDARAGVGEYWLIDLNSRTMIVQNSRDAGYSDAQAFTSAATVTSQAFADLPIDLRRLLD